MIILLLLLQNLSVLAKTVCEGETFCLSGSNWNSNGASGSAPANQSLITMTVFSSLKGWAAMGFGKEMSNSVIITGWLNSTSGYTVTTMTAKSKKIPDISSSQIAHPVELAKEKPKWAKLAFSFQIQQENVLHSISTDDNYIWASGDEIPLNIDSGASQFSMHSVKGTFPNADMITSSALSSTSSSLQDPILTLLFLALF